MQTGENIQVVFPLHHKLTDHSLQKNETLYIIMNKACKAWSHSYLRARCSSSICSLTAFSSLSRATSVPFTHVYTTSIGIGRQSLKRNTAVTQDSLKNVKAVTHFSSPGAGLPLFWKWFIFYSCRVTSRFGQKAGLVLADSFCCCKPNVSYNILWKCCFCSPALVGFSTQIVSVWVKHHMVLVPTPLHHHLHWRGRGIKWFKTVYWHLLLHPKLTPTSTTPILTQTLGSPFKHTIYAHVDAIHSLYFENICLKWGVESFHKASFKL